MKLHVMIFKCAGKLEGIREVVLDNDVQPTETNRILVQVLSSIKYRKHYQMHHLMVVSKSLNKKFTRLFPASIIYSSNFGVDWYQAFEGVADACQSGVHDECDGCDCPCHPQIATPEKILPFECPWCNHKTEVEMSRCQKCGNSIPPYASRPLPEREDDDKDPITGNDTNATTDNKPHPKVLG